MKNNVVILSFVVSLFGICSVFASPRIVTDPVADYVQRHANDLRPPEERNEHVLKFEIDVDNDGKVDVFLSSEKSSLLSKEYDNAVRAWDLYKNEGGGSFSGGNGDGEDGFELAGLVGGDVDDDGFRDGCGDGDGAFDG